MMTNYWPVDRTIYWRRHRPIWSQILSCPIADSTNKTNQSWPINSSHNTGPHHTSSGLVPVRYLPPHITPRKRHKISSRLFIAKIFIESEEHFHVITSYLEHEIHLKVNCALQQFKFSHLSWTIHLMGRCTSPSHWPIKDMLWWGCDLVMEVTDWIQSDITNPKVKGLSCILPNLFITSWNIDNHKTLMGHLYTQYIITFIIMYFSDHEAMYLSFPIYFSDIFPMLMNDYSWMCVIISMDKIHPVSWYNFTTLNICQDACLESNVKLIQHWQGHTMNNIQ